MRTTLKKLLALALSVMMIVGVFVACGGEETPKTTPDEFPATSGIITVNTGALVSIRYDVLGNTDGIIGDNDLGLAIAEEYTDYEGKPVADVIKKLISLSAEKKALNEDISTVLIKIASGTVFQSEEKRNELVKAAQEALDEVKSKAIPMLIDEENLTGEGYLTLSTVKKLLMNKHGVEKFDAFYGDTLPNNNFYLVTVEIDGVQYSYTIDAFNGFISVASQEDLLGDMEEDIDEEEETEPVEDDYTVPEGDEPVDEEPGDIEIPID